MHSRKGISTVDKLRLVVKVLVRKKITCLQLPRAHPHFAVQDAQMVLTFGRQ